MRHADTPPRQPTPRGRLLAGLLLVAVAVGACVEFESKYEYHGARRLSPEPMNVKTVFWPDDEPVVFATRRLESGERTMNLVPISGRPGCETGSLTRFAAVADDRGFRLALLNEDEHQLRFYDSDCEVVDPVLDEVEGMGLRTAGGVHRFLVQTLAGELLSVDPYEGTQVGLANGVWRVGSGLVRLPDREAVWVLADHGLSVIDLNGVPVTGTLKDVAAFAYHVKPGVGGGVLVATEDVHGEGIVLANWLDVVFKGAPVEDREILWTEDGACGPRIDNVYDGCRGNCNGVTALVLDQDATDEGPAGGDSVWVSMYSPCDENWRLVVRRADRAPDPNDGQGEDEESTPPEAIEVAEHVREYRLLGRAIAGRPMFVFRQETGDSRQDFFALAGQPPIPFGTDIALDSISVLVAGVAATEDQLPAALAATTLRLLTADHRWGTWNPEDGFEPLLEGVQFISGQGLVLHDFDGRSGTLSFCLLSRCIHLADRVPDDAFYSYETVERINDGRPVFAFVHDLDPMRNFGTLTVVDRVTGRRVDVAEGVQTFAPIELGSARGVVYSVPEGPDRGLWYAPR